MRFRMPWDNWFEEACKDYPVSKVKIEKIKYKELPFTCPHCKKEIG